MRGQRVEYQGFDAPGEFTETGATVDSVKEHMRSTGAHAAIQQAPRLVVRKV